ncbi:hypothetical protein RKE38_10700 [Phycicoccus sp. M110.8]|uniref:hypothetical protein n=1 Tax=Phycicoccus sp. M110.8 TaxID=3075433 RepID=UPI0028FDB31E|nr:hypothetical protein [Phycicoccus sp. M110.8]MDU0314154.1 hypothetical protein [Phycicoccus sp. M110.8]
MPSTTRGTGSGYEVAVPGSLRPSHRAALVSDATLGVELTTVFLLRPVPDPGIGAIARELEARGLVIVDIRRVGSPHLICPG